MRFPRAPGSQTRLDDLPTFDLQATSIEEVAARCEAESFDSFRAIAAEGDRASWELRFFQAGFRKHPLTMLYRPFSCLEPNEGKLPLHLEMQRIPPPALASYPLESLQSQRGRHMDFLRETGRRSDAYLARYAIALRFIEPGDRVLDVGCGLGFGCAMMLDAGTARRVTGLDNSKFAIEYSNANYLPHRPGLSFINGDMEELSSVKKGSFDLITCMGALVYSRDVKAVLHSFNRLLRKGGKVVLGVENEWIDEYGFPQDPDHLQVFSYDSLYMDTEKYFKPLTMLGLSAGGGARHLDVREEYESAMDLKMPPNPEWWIMVAQKLRSI